MKRISSDAWAHYVDAHARIQSAARDELMAFFNSLPWRTDEAAALRALCEKAADIANMYGTADATLSAAFYDELMTAYGMSYLPAEIVIPNAEFDVVDVANAANAAASVEAAAVISAGEVVKHVKRAGVQTMRNAASRDGAMWAWVCIGDTCAFCRALGSNGWQEASERIKAGNHADHIHGNCDCQFVVKPNGASLEIEGYDPDALYDEYKDADGWNSKDKVNAMRRADYTPEFAEERNRRRRELYKQANNQD